MKKLSLALVAVLAATALLATAVPSPAASGVKTVKTKLTVKFQNGGDIYTPADSFSGKVKAKKKTCKKGRKIVVKGPSGTVGKTKSNKKGKWVVTDGDVAPGQYTAKAKQKKKGNLKCKKAKKKITVS